MNGRILVATAVGAVGIAIAVITWKNVAALLTATAAREETRASSRQLEERVRELQLQCTAAELAAARIEESLKQGGLVQTSKKTSPPPATPMQRRTGSIQDLIRDEPDAQVLYLAASRAALAQTYGPLFHRLRLSAAQIGSFQENVIRRGELQMDLNNTASEGGDPAAVAALQRTALADYNTAQRALLGESGFRQFQDYERTSAARTMVSTIVGVAAIERVPFTPLQADQLVQAVADASRSYRDGGAVLEKHDAVDWASVETRARAILNEQQFEVFRTMDPGNAGGLLQTRLYAIVNQAVESDREDLAKPRDGRPGS